MSRLLSGGGNARRTRRAIAERDRLDRQHRYQLLDATVNAAQRAFGVPGTNPLSDFDRDSIRRAALRLLAALDGDRDTYLANC